MNKVLVIINTNPESIRIICPIVTFVFCFIASFGSFHLSFGARKSQIVPKTVNAAQSPAIANVYIINTVASKTNEFAITAEMTAHGTASALHAMIFALSIVFISIGNILSAASP